MACNAAISIDLDNTDRLIEVLIPKMGDRNKYSAGHPRCPYCEEEEDDDSLISGLRDVVRGLKVVDGRRRLARKDLPNMLDAVTVFKSARDASCDSMTV